MSFEIVDIDADAFEGLIRIPEVGYWFTADGNAEGYTVARVPGALFGSVFDADTLLLYAAQPINKAAMVVLVATHPERRKSAVLAAKEAEKRLKERAPGWALFSMTPADNDASIGLQQMLGWRHVGTLYGAYFRKDQRLNLEIHQCS